MAPDQRPVPLHLNPALRALPDPIAVAPETPDGILADGITTAIVGLLRAHTGRGATAAKTAIASDLLVVSLADSFTRLERRLVERGSAAYLAPPEPRPA
jgi:hypothetical protein